MRVQSVESETPLAFIHRLQQSTALERKPLKFAYSRLNSLLRLVDIDFGRIGCQRFSRGEGFTVKKKKKKSDVIEAKRPIMLIFIKHEFIIKRRKTFIIFFLWKLSYRRGKISLVRKEQNTLCDDVVGRTSGHGI